MIRRHHTMEQINVQVGEEGLKVAFEGRWLVYPKLVHSYTGEEGYGAGAY